MSKLVYDLKKGDKKLSTNFNISEFKSPDSNKVIIYTELVSKLQKIRDHFGKSITVTSGYRTPAHNRAIGGASSSKHTLGMAADIQIKGVDPCQIALYAQKLGFGGVECGCYASGGYVHVDVRSGSWRAVKAFSNKTYTTVNNLFPTVKNGSTGQTVVMLQRKLNALGYYGGDIDGKAGNGTVNSIEKYQKAKGLKVDGVCGSKMYEKLFG